MKGTDINKTIRMLCILKTFQRCVHILEPRRSTSSWLRNYFPEISRNVIVCVKDNLISHS